MGRPFASSNLDESTEDYEAAYKDELLSQVMQINAKLTTLVSLFTDFMLWQIQPVQDDDPFPTALASRIEQTVKDIGGDAYVGLLGKVSGEQADRE